MIYLQIGIGLGFIAVYALFGVYAERKVSAYIQNRVGPLETGPLGLFQTAADILKLLTKEKIVPSAADKILFLLAPVLIFVAVFAGFAAVPFGPDWVGTGLNVGLLYVMGIVSIDVIGLIMAGWASNNKYSLLGAIRSVSQILSYEIPAGLALLAGVMMVGSLDLNVISQSQGLYAENTPYLFGAIDVGDNGGILAWNIVRYPHLIVAWMIFFIASLAECNRAPFDLPEAESEIISGYHTEYTGFRFALMMLAEYTNMLLVGMLGAIVFLGGWNTIFPNIHFGDFTLALGDWTSGAPGTISGAIWGAVWVILKGFASVFVFMWIRWTLPRFRVDQLMRLSWKVLTPVAFILFVISGAWKLVEVYVGGGT